MGRERSEFLCVYGGQWCLTDLILCGVGRDAASAVPGHKEWPGKVPMTQGEVPSNEKQK